MFLIAELILFSPLIIYACISVRKLIPKIYFKNIFILVYILVFLGYPIAELFSHREISGWARVPVIIGYYCLSYLLYFILLAVTIDIVIVLARITRILHSATISGSGFRAIRLGCCLIIPAMIVFAGALNNNRLRIKEYSIELPQKSSTIKELKIVYASDFHLSQLTNSRLLERFVYKVNALHPEYLSRQL